MSPPRAPRYARLTPARRSRPAAWIDAAENTGLVGWVYWPADDEGKPKLEATLNGDRAPLSIDIASRPDVPQEIGVAGPVHGFRIDYDVCAWRLDDQVSVAISSADTSLDVWTGSVGALFAQMIPRAWPAMPPSLVTNALATGMTCQEPPAGLANGAVSAGTSVEAQPAEFFTVARPIGPRFDFAVSRYQAYSYLRHVRDHPGFRTDRHFPAATRATLVEYLTWSLRMFAGNYPFAPLPIGATDTAALNEPVSGSGLGKGHGPGVMRSRLFLTAAQVPFVRERHSRVEASDEAEMADWLLEWLGSWGWGHKGLRLMTPAQIDFLTGEDADVHDPGSVGACSQLSRYAKARLREHEHLRHSYAELHLPHVRKAFLLELAAGEVSDVGSDALVPTEFLQWVREPETLRAMAEAIHPTAAHAPLAKVPESAAAYDVTPRTIPVRVLGMMDSKSGLGQNARNSVDAVKAAGLDCDAFSISINDRSVSASTLRLLAPGASRVNIWHLNPDNLPEAVCTLDPAIYMSSYNIGFFAWELDVQPRAHHLATEWVDEIWVPSRYCADSFRTITDKSIQVMPHAVDIPQDLQPFSRERLGLTGDDFLVHCSFDMHSWPQRKNPLGTIEAFQRAFDDDRAYLLLKIRNGLNIGLVDSDRDMIGNAVLELAEGDERILVDVKERSYAETLALIAAADCHISLHRSEGFGYTLAESLALGVPLLCTDYAGSRDFCDAENAWLVPATERLLHEGEYYLAPPGARWGEPDLAVAADHLRQIRAGDDRVSTKVANGLARSAELGLRQMSALYGARLAELLA